MFKPLPAVQAVRILRRIVFGAIALEVFSYWNNPVWFAGLPPELRISFPVTGPLFDRLPVTAPLAWITGGLLLTACAMTAAGIFTRAAAAAASCLALYVLAIPKLFGPPDWISPHNHHLIWFGFLLAAAPAERVKGSPDLGPGSPASDERSAAAVIFCMRTLLGIIYLFPGIWKLTGAFSGASLERTILEVRHWAVTPPLIAWNAPRPLLDLAAAGVIVFEVSFIFLLLHRRARGAAAVLGLLFHGMTFFFLKISFWPLLVCYFCLWPIERAARPSAGPPVRFAAHAVGAVLILTNVGFGALRIDSWPFAVYPTFTRAVAAGTGEICVRAVNADGTENALDMRPWVRRYGSARWKSLARRIADGGPNASTLAAGLSKSLAMSLEDAGSGRKIRIYRMRPRQDLSGSVYDPEEARTGTLLFG